MGGEERFLILTLATEHSLSFFFIVSCNFLSFFLYLHCELSSANFRLFPSNSIRSQFPRPPLFFSPLLFSFSIPF